MELSTILFSYEYTIGSIYLPDKTQIPVITITCPPNVVAHLNPIVSLSTRSVIPLSDTSTKEELLTVLLAVASQHKTTRFASAAYRNMEV